MEFGPKTLIDSEFFRDRFSGPVKPTVMLVGQRSLGAGSEIRPDSYGHALHALVKYMVVGLGVYQGIEFVLERGWWELAGRTGMAASRLRNAIRLLAGVRPHRFVLGRDTDSNVRTLVEFIERCADGVGADSTYTVRHRAQGRPPQRSPPERSAGL
jgi:hypothetical protein